MKYNMLLRKDKIYSSLHAVILRWIKYLTHQAVRFYRNSRCVL